MKSKMRFLVSLGFAIFIVTGKALAETHPVKGQFGYGYSISDPIIFLISNPNGDIRVKAHNQSTVLIRGFYKGNKPGVLHIDQVKQGMVKIEIEYPRPPIQNLGEGVFVGGNVTGSVVIGGGSISIDTLSRESANMEVLLPRHMLAHLKVESLLGNITVEDFSEVQADSTRFIYVESNSGNVSLKNLKAPGGITARLCNGSACVDNVESDLEVRSDNGSVSIFNAIGSASLTTSNGKIHVSNVTGQLELESSNGDVSVSGGEGDVLAKSNVGKITVEERKGRISAKTTVGNIVFNNPESTSEYAKTSIGGISGIRNPCAANLVLGISRRSSDEEDFFRY